MPKALGGMEASNAALVSCRNRFIVAQAVSGYVEQNIVELGCSTGQSMGRTEGWVDVM